MTKKQGVEKIRNRIAKSNIRKDQIINNNIGKNGVIKNQRIKRQSEREKELQKSRNKERERRARGNRKYGQAKLKHAKKGIWSCTLAGIVFVCLTSLLVIAYMSGGTTAGYIGGLGMISMILSGAGVGFAVRGFKEREKDYLACKIGLGFNLFFFISFIAIFCRGLF